MSDRLTKRYTSEFFNLGSPCGFPGCEDLRKKYIAELRDTLRPTGGCAACKRMSLVKKYKQLITNRIKIHQ
jgi:hypothetical protein